MVKIVTEHEISWLLPHSDKLSVILLWLIERIIRALDLILSGHWIKLAFHQNVEE